jgi:hypothetical protein
VSIVVGDASRDELDRDAPNIRTLELFCVRAGIKVLSLSARGVAGIGDAATVHRPDLVVVAGGHLDDDTVARWAYAIRLAVGAMPLAIYRRGAERPRVRSTGTTVLPAGPGDAQRTLLDMLESEQVMTGSSGSVPTAESRAQSQARLRRSAP